MKGEMWQLYGEDGIPLAGQGAAPKEIGKGLLHGAAHVWVWRSNYGVKQVLLQKRSANTKTYQNLYDATAAGHIDLGETPLRTAERELLEETGLRISKEDIHLIFIDRKCEKVPNSDIIENEFNHVYAVELESNAELTLQPDEVASLHWCDLEVFKMDVSDVEKSKKYVPHSKNYFRKLFKALNNLSNITDN